MEDAMTASRVAVVTGSNRGIGYSLVKALSTKFDGDVYLTSRNPEQGEDAVKRLKNEGLNVIYHQLDIDNMSSISILKDFIVRKYGGIDLLINNAGVMFTGRHKLSSSEKVELTMKTNFFSTLNVSKVFLPHLKENSRVVNMSSFLGITGLNACSPPLQEKFRSKLITENELTSLMQEYVDLAQSGKLKEKGWPRDPYNVSKLGVIVMSRVHANLLTQNGKPTALVNSCCPGWVQTDMGGPSAPKTVDEGIETPLYLALLPKGTTGLQGEFVSEKSVRHW